MTVRTRSTTAARLSGVLLSLGLLACQEAHPPLEPDESGVTQVKAHIGAHGSAAVLDRQLAELRRTTAGFHDFEAATAAGHTVLVAHPETGATCLEHPTDGGMGRHYLDPTRFNDDVVSITEPEVVIYEPTKNGKLRLVAFEYVVPYAVRGPGETPPTLFGQDFLHNPTFELWMLHVYVWKRNPNGMFATWNPRITCEHDDAAG